MATQPLFDITKIDLSAVTVSPERVGQINPQAGSMRQLDHIIWIRDDAKAGLGVKLIRDDEFWVPVHIPGRPLMPGVLMIEAAAQLCSVLQKHAYNLSDETFLGFTRCDQVAFRGQVVPGDTLYLLAEEVEQRRRRFVSKAQAMVDGRLVFEAVITGMSF